jgi:hypothetical protein
MMSHVKHEHDGSSHKMATQPLSKRINVAITEEMKARILALGERRATKESDIVRRAIEAYLRKEESR